MKTKIWFITGASRGFGRIWAEAALARGDKVAATARHVDDLSDLIDTFEELVLPLALDVTHRQDEPVRPYRYVRGVGSSAGTGRNASPGCI